MSIEIKCPALRDIYSQIKPGTEVIIEYSKEHWFYTTAGQSIPLGLLASKVLLIEARDKDEIHIKVDYAGGTG